MSRMTRRTAVGVIAAAPAALATSAQAASHAAQEIVIENFSFNPKELSVKAGEAVRFTNKDGSPHTGTARDGSFNTGTIQKGQSKEVEIAAGTHEFFCKFHPNMKGTIIGT